MQLSVAIFNRQLRAQGQAVSWAYASFCPCRSPDTGGAKPGCPVCGARGVLWAAPVPSYAGICGMKVQKEWASYAAFESGDVVISVPCDTPLYAAGENDRVVMLQSSETFDVVHVHGTGRETPTYTILSIDRCFWLTPDGSAVVEGGLPIQNADLTLTWPDGQLEPPAGVQYTLRGRRIPEYFLFKDLTQDRAHYGGQAYPRRVALRKWDLFPK